MKQKLVYINFDLAWWWGTISRQKYHAWNFPIHRQRGHLPKFQAQSSPIRYLEFGVYWTHILHDDRVLYQDNSEEYGVFKVSLWRIGPILPKLGVQNSATMCPEIHTPDSFFSKYYTIVGYISPRKAFLWENWLICYTFSPKPKQSDI